MYICVFFCISILFSALGPSLPSLLQILFQVDSLFPPLMFGLLDFYHAHSPAGYFSAFLFCLVCYVQDPLSAGWKVIGPLDCGVFSLWVGLDHWLVKDSWLRELVSVFLGMELYLIPLQGSAVSSGELCHLWE